MAQSKARKAAAPSFLRLSAALVLLAAATTVVQLEIAAAQDDECIPLDLICKDDEVCRACQEVVGTNVPLFEECQLNYGFSDDICINQSAQPCCQDFTSKNDCLANEAYTNFYECRLERDVPGGDCTVLNCDAVGAAVFEDDETTFIDDDGAPAADPQTDDETTLMDDDETTFIDDDTATGTAGNATTTTDADMDTTTDTDTDTSEPASPAEDDEIEAVVADDDPAVEGDDADAEASANANGAGRPAGKAAGFLVTAGLSVVAAVAAFA